MKPYRRVRKGDALDANSDFVQYRRRATVLQRVVCIAIIAYLVTIFALVIGLL